MEDKRFQKRVENFVCEQCDHEVVGTGYTDHCPHCLWSKHVDIYPGDRKSICRGMMRPIALEGSSPEYRIVYRCILCNYVHRVNAALDDRRETLVTLAEGVYNHPMEPDEIKKELEDALEKIEPDPPTDPFAKDAFGHDPAKEIDRGEKNDL